MQLVIESVKPTSSGKSLVVKAGGKDYFAKTASGVQAGMTIEAELKDSHFNGKTNTWIEKWRPVNGAPQSSSGSVGGNGSAWLPMASNLTAHAINAGLIKDPTEIKVWVLAAKQAYEEAVK